MADTSSSRGSLRTVLSKLGPGLITGAADDDPSGIGTYSVAGAQFGYGPLWTTWFLYPLMLAVQIMCARLGMVSGEGLGALIRKRYGAWALWAACVLLIAANVVNIAADLGAMAESTGMVAGISSLYITPVFTIILIGFLSLFSYQRLARLFKWMTLALFAYLIAAFLAHPDWSSVARYSLLPHVEHSRDYVMMLLALAGTTISPYLFFWQASQEVEEEREKGRITVQQRKGATRQELRDSKLDVALGMLFSNVVMYFIILTTAATLHAHGKTSIATTADAARALQPLAGKATYLLFTMGIIGSGMLSVPVLAGSAAFAVAEGVGWRHSLKYRPRQAPAFYGVLTASLVVGMLLSYLKVSAVKMLFWAAVVNGVLAPPMLLLVVLMSSDGAVMGKHVASPLLRTTGWVATLVMTIAAIAAFVV